MQLYALDSQSNSIFSERADKSKEYYCLECGSKVKCRGGDHRRTHFYHVHSHETCHLNKKSMEHLQTQWYLFSLFPKEDVKLEHRFPEINRIADVVWFKEKIIFEIQCSKMSQEEALNRTSDYKKAGYHVIWILHDMRYNNYRLTSIELGLKNYGFYFTNINSEGVGAIYDQIDSSNKSVRKILSSFLTIHPNAIHKSSKIFLPSLLKNRSSRIYFFEGDAIDLYKKRDLKVIGLMNAKENQKTFSLQTILDNYLLYPYHLLFQIVLEKFCK